MKLNYALSQNYVEMFSRLDQSDIIALSKKAKENDKEILYLPMTISKVGEDRYTLITTDLISVNERVFNQEGLIDFCQLHHISFII